MKNIKRVGPNKLKETHLSRVRPRHEAALLTIQERLTSHGRLSLFYGKTEVLHIVNTLDTQIRANCRQLY